MLATVYYSGTLKDYLSIQDDSIVQVSDSPPEKFEVLVKCHPKYEDLSEVQEGVYTATWKILNKYPMERNVNG